MIAKRNAADRPPPVRHGALTDDEATSPGVWVLIWTIFIAKLVTILLVIWAAHSYETGALVAATTWQWLVLAAVLAATPLLSRYRLRRVRAKRERLQRAEWMLTGELTPEHPTVLSSPRR